MALFYMLFSACHDKIKLKLILNSQKRRKYYYMAYPDWKGLPDKLHRIIEYTALQHEYGCDSEAIKKIIEKLESNMADSLDAVLQLSQDPVLKNREPDELEKIKKL